MLGNNFGFSSDNFMYKKPLIGHFYPNQVLKCYKHVIKSTGPGNKAKGTGRGGRTQVDELTRRARPCSRDQWKAHRLSPFCSLPMWVLLLPEKARKTGVSSGRASSPFTGWQRGCSRKQVEKVKGIFLPKTSGFSRHSGQDEERTQQQMQIKSKWGWWGSWSQSWVKEMEHNVPLRFQPEPGELRCQWECSLESSQARGACPAWVLVEGPVLKEIRVAVVVETSPNRWPGDISS